MLDRNTPEIKKRHKYYAKIHCLKPSKLETKTLAAICALIDQDSQTWKPKPEHKKIDPTQERRKKKQREVDRQRANTIKTWLYSLATDELRILHIKARIHPWDWEYSFLYTSTDGTIIFNPTKFENAAVKVLRRENIEDIEAYVKNLQSAKSH